MVVPDAPFSSLYDTVPGSPAELRFRRLLHCCQAHIVGQRRTSHTHIDTDKPVQQQEQGGISAIKLKGFVDALNDQFTDLERSCALPQTTLDTYRQHVRAITARVKTPQLPAYCCHLKGSGSTPALPGAVGAAYPLRPPQPGGNSPPAGSLWDTSTLSASTVDRLKQHENIQESLTGELADMAASLKEGMLGVQSAVRHRGQLLERTEEAMDDSVARAKAVAARSKEEIKRGGGNLCLTILVILIVCGGFAAMVFWIKFTSLLGMGRRSRARVEEL